MILYHGSNVTVNQPMLIRQNRYLDFGFGFYTTTNREQAVNFAQKVTERRKIGDATLNTYLVDENVTFKECSLLDLTVLTRSGWIFLLQIVRKLIREKSMI